MAIVTMTSARRLSIKPKHTRSSTGTNSLDELDVSHRRGGAKHISIDWGEIDAPCSPTSTKPQNEMDLSMHSSGGSTASTADDSTCSLDSSNRLAAKNIDNDEDDAKVVRTSVRFGAVEIREYPRALGDNPCVSSGAPLTLGWEYSSFTSMDLESYEATRPSRRVKSEMAVPHMIRDDWLREAGYSRSDITEATRAARDIQAQRRKSTSQNKAGRKADEIRESFGRFRRRCSL